MYLVFIVLILFIIMLIKIGKKTNEELKKYDMSYDDYDIDDLENDLILLDMLYDDDIDVEDLYTMDL